MIHQYTAFDTVHDSEVQFFLSALSTRYKSTNSTDDIRYQFNVPFYKGWREEYLRSDIDNGGTCHVTMAVYCMGQEL